jgi:hypothetical protein
MISIVLPSLFWFFVGGRRGISHCLENAQSEIPRWPEDDRAEGALECGGLTPPCSFQIHADQHAK